MLVKKDRKRMGLGILCVIMAVLSGCYEGSAPVGGADPVTQVTQPATEAPAAGGEESQQSIESMQSAESQEASQGNENSGSSAENSGDAGQTESAEISDGTQGGEEQTAPSTWEEAYKTVVCSALDYVGDPRELRQYSLEEPANKRLWIQLYDFDQDEIPELIVGDSCCVSVFTWQNQELVRLADLAQMECWGGHDGMNFLNGTLMLDGDGSQGSGYVFYAYRDGKYQMAKYCDYHEEEAEIDGVYVDAQKVRDAYDVHYGDYQHCGFYRVNLMEGKVTGYYFTDWDTPVDLKEEFPLESFYLK